MKKWWIYLTTLLLMLLLIPSVAMAGYQPMAPGSEVYGT